ncbi:MAG: zinc ribbon domain-containing protein [Chloroflexi bacterium]|nr:zinc ribbon domain-containing protein [Chloroflexota bacterium]MDA8187252.1 zinc ribbon domain-containing protein [Dehalococcoidales bacterium]
MPLYEYQCTECNEKFEKLVRSSFAEAEVSCPNCGSSLVKRLVSLFGALGFSGAGASSGCAPTGGG